MDNEQITSEALGYILTLIAKILAGLIIVGGVIVFFVNLFGGHLLIGLFYLLGAAISVCISAIPIYGIGQILQDTAQIKQDTAEIKKMLEADTTE